MAKGTRIVGGMTQQLYHTIPDDKDYIITSPNKEAIFQFLSQIGFNRFPEFVKDILVKVERHTLIDITDGPGDEKQDILTLALDGERCLTQCKHSIHPNSKYTGEELDVMVGACCRKNCKYGILVTNTDLTPPAKRYVTDEEYLRGMNNPAGMPIIDYWNDSKIWDKIKNNRDILNKWFGHLGQTDGLRNFKFEFAVQNLPLNAGKPEEGMSAIPSRLMADKKIIETGNGKFQGELPDGTVFILEKGILFPNKLNMNYLLQDSHSAHNYNVPVRSFTIEANVTNNGKYSPGEVRQTIAAFLAQYLPLPEGDGSWCHITTSQAISFIFLHDIGETRQITLNNAETFVDAEGGIVSELEYVSLQPTHFSLKTSADDDTIYVHKDTGTEVTLLFDQPMNPYQVYEHQRMQLAQLDLYRTYDFRKAKGIDTHLMIRIRRILDKEWLAIQIGENAMVWGVPPDFDKAGAERIEAKLATIGLQVIQVSEDERDDMLASVRSDMPPPTFYIVAELARLSYPVDLPSRMFWLSKNLPPEASMSAETAARLLEFKYYYEKEYGFDNMGDKTEFYSHTVELPSLLADIFSVRGERMLDIGINNKPYSVHVRFGNSGVEDSTTLALRFLTEFTRVYEAIREFVLLRKEIDFHQFQNESEKHDAG